MTSQAPTSRGPTDAGLTARVLSSEWQPIETAPKDGTSILVFGKPSEVKGAIIFRKLGAFTAYFDACDDAFCLSGATWMGPFINPTHWMPLPTPPVQS